MSSRLIEIFEDARLVNGMKSKLPYLFQLAELESSRAGKIGMEVGSLRERLIIALLIYKFGEANNEKQEKKRNSDQFLWLTGQNQSRFYTFLHKQVI